MTDYQVPRHAFAWLLLAQAFLLFPHLWRFPAILVPVWVFCTLWRVMIYQGRWTYPSALVKAVLVLFSFIAIGLVQRRWLMVETAILTLLIAFLLKLLEMRQKRDVLVSIYLAYFVLATELLLSQSVLAGLYLVAGLCFVTAALIALQSINNETAWSHPLLQSAKMLVLSVPLMLVAFLVFPRLEPLWKVPMPAGAGKTGVSGSMTPGAIAELAQSDALAFRVRFEGEVPALQDLYWRGVVLTRFDGKTWLPDSEETPVNAETLAISRSGLPPYRYRITMEPSHQPWLFVLAGVVQTDGRAYYYRDFSLQAVDVISQRESWNFVSYSDALLGLEISPRYRQSALQLPPGYNPQTLEFARQLFAQSVSPDDYLQKVLAHFSREEFYYTLTPPLSAGHTVDDFLFNSRRGFCEHYASAFVVLMRAAGIPARVIAGYQGGDINPYEDNVTVRQLDAHAWAEVWLAGKGWLRVDPTYAVAPERIEKGSQESLQNEEEYLAQAPFSPIRYRNLSWLLSMQYRYDQLNFLWHSWVLDYSGERRESVLLAMLGNTSPRTIAIFVAAMFALFGLLFASVVLLRYRPPAYAPAERIYRRMLKKMARQGLQKMPAEGAMGFGKRAAQRWPQSAQAIENLTRQYLYLNYAKTTDVNEESRLLKQFRRDVIALQLR